MPVLPDVSVEISAVTVLVSDPDRSLAFYCEGLGFELAEDSVAPNGKRWVRVRGGALELVLATSKLEHHVQDPTRLAEQAGGRVLLFARVRGLDALVTRLTSRGALLEGPIRSESYGRVCVVRDPDGHRIDLIEL